MIVVIIGRVWFLLYNKSVVGKLVMVNDGSDKEKWLRRGLSQRVISGHPFPTSPSAAYNQFNLLCAWTFES